MIKHYKREHRYNRGRSDITREILTSLAELGPIPVTQILYRIALSHAQAKVYLNYLTNADLIVRRPFSEMTRDLSKKQLGRLGEMSDNVTDLYIITGKGEKYLNKLNELEIMIKWNKPPPLPK